MCLKPKLMHIINAPSTPLRNKQWSKCGFFLLLSSQCSEKVGFEVSESLMVPAVAHVHGWQYLRWWGGGIPLSPQSARIRLHLLFAGNLKLHLLCVCPSVCACASGSNAPIRRPCDMFLSSLAARFSGISDFSPAICEQ